MGSTAADDLDDEGWSGSRAVVVIVAAVVVLAAIGVATALVLGGDDDAAAGTRSGPLGAAATSTTFGRTPQTGPERWSAMAKAPVAARSNALTAWTGTELLVWGGPGPQGAAYDPTANRWRTISPGPLTPRSRFTLTWDGHQAVLVGGVDRRSIAADLGPDGATGGLARTVAYDPVTDRWRSLPSLGTGRSGHSAVWTQQGIMVVGGSRNRQGDAATTTELLTPSGRWKEIAASPLLQVDGAAYTWSSVVAFGALAKHAPTADDPYPVGRPAFALYDPKADRWRTVDPSPSRPSADPERLVSPTVTWTGREVVVLGAPIANGIGAGGKTLQGIALEPTGRVLRSIESPLSARHAMTAVWTGDQLVVWGGARYTGFGGPVLGNGAAYRPGEGH